MVRFRASAIEKTEKRVMFVLLWQIVIMGFVNFLREVKSVFDYF